MSGSVNKRSESNENRKGEGVQRERCFPFSLMFSIPKDF